MAVIETGGTVWAVATRICQLDPTGAIVPGSNTFTTDTLLKATITPVTEGTVPGVRSTTELALVSQLFG